MRSTDSSKQHIPRFSRFLITIPVMLALSGLGCAAKTTKQIKPVSEEGLNVVRIETHPDLAQPNTQPVSLAPTEVATILRGVRAWERRNMIHRLVSGEAVRTRAFRDDEIAFLAPAISRALAQAGPSDRVYFHLSHATQAGEEETTTGWIFLRDPLLHLVLTEVHDRHGPGPDISKYDRQMPDVPEASGSFDVTFEPEQYLAKVVSGGGLFSTGQHEELRILYREALPALPSHPLDEKVRQSPSSQ
ncbi:MAG: hypothetical protein ACREJU_19115 [Nitrospiraceae bacterium]